MTVEKIVHELAGSTVYTKMDTLKAFLHVTKAASVNTFSYFVVHKVCSMPMTNIKNGSFTDSLEALGYQKRHSQTSQIDLMYPDLLIPLVRGEAYQSKSRQQEIPHRATQY